MDLLINICFMPRPTNSRAGEELPLSNLMLALFSPACGLFALEMMNFHENERSRRRHSIMSARELVINFSRFIFIESAEWFTASSLSGLSFAKYKRNVNRVSWNSSFCFYYLLKWDKMMTEKRLQKVSFNYQNVFRHFLGLYINLIRAFKLQSDII